MSKKCSYKGCKGKVVGSYTVDMDIDGLYFCTKHKSTVSGAMLWLILGIPDMAEKALGLQTENKKKKVTPKMKDKKK